MKGSPFKLRSPLLELSEEGPGTISAASLTTPVVSYATGVETNDKADKSLTTVDNTEQPVHNTDTTAEDQKNALMDQIKNFKGSGNTAFDRDGRSVDKFDQRIADAESKGKLSRVQRLKNRKSGYMESQADKLEKAGGTLTNQQKIDLNQAGGESGGGTKTGKFFRKLLGRDFEKRKVDPVKKDDEDKDNGNNEFNGFGPV